MHAPPSALRSALAWFALGLAAHAEEILPSYARPESRLTRLWSEGEFTEGPAAAPDGAILFSDIGDRILRFDPATNQTRVFREPSGRANGLAFDALGRLVTCEGANTGGGRRVSLTEADGTVRTLADRFEGMRLNSPNDLAIDSRGRIWFSDPRYVGGEPRELAGESVYRIDPDGRVRLAVAAREGEGVVKPNGLALSPDESLLYVADTPGAQEKASGARSLLLAFPIESDGSLGPRRVLHDFGDDRGVDGMAVAEDGSLLVTAGSGTTSGVYRLSPEGRRIGWIPTPEDASNCCFAGPGSDRLYVTAGRSLYRIDLVVRAPDPGGPPHQAVETTAPGDWPAWRGPARDGVAAADETVPLVWSEEPGRERNILWSADVPGRGHGSPCVAGGRVYLATCDEASGSQSVIAFDASDGRRLWLREIHTSGAMRKNERSTGASCTPACDGERVMVAFPNDGAIVATALSLDGGQRWQTKVGDYVIHQGYGASPLVHGGLVIVSCDNKGGGSLVALDRRTGAEAWRRRRPATPNYSSPVVHRLFGRDQLVMTGCDRVAAYDPLTGETLWEIAGATTECVTTTVTDGERIYSSGGYPRNHVAAIRADGSGRVEWENAQRLYVPSLLHHAGHLYAVLDAGIAICWNAATGEERWKQRLGGGFSSSPVLVGDVILATDEAGRTHLFRADPERFTPLGENTLGDECFASPAVCGGRLFMRVATHDGDTRREKLVCIGARP
jgi:outer membrane protein assembly factor BamB